MTELARWEDLPADPSDQIMAEAAAKSRIDAELVKRKNISLE